MTENLPKDADARREHLLDEGPRAVLCYREADQE